MVGHLLLAALTYHSKTGNKSGHIIFFRGGFLRNKREHYYYSVTLDLESSSQIRIEFASTRAHYLC